MVDQNVITKATMPIHTFTLNVNLILMTIKFIYCGRGDE